DSLMGNREISYEDKALIDEALLIAKGDPERVLIEATKVLSALSGLAAVATTSPGNDARIHKIKFISVSRYISMLILITSTGIVKNKLFHCDYVLTTEILNVFEIALNEKLSGFPLKDITPAFIQTTAISLSDLALLLPNVLAALMEAAKEAAKTFFALEGQMNLLFLNEDFDILNAKNAIRFLLSGDEITALLLSRPNKTAVLIGGEIGNPLLSNISIVSARYMISDQVAGSLAIIGPTRMDYAKATTVIKYTSDSVSDIITELINI
ncbi:MAG: HrcA family transcriptional regulator, partial [Bacillota bacterium]|nr:HrcA family transcriptional regulator [Bacillota bacterium]